MEIINFNILKHPMNWLIVMLFVVIAGIGLHFVMQYQTAPSKAKS
jgi:hypothetical protein